MVIVEKIIKIALNYLRENKVPEIIKTNTTNKRSVFLQQVEQIIVSDRAISYGPPENSFQNIANLWNAYLTAKNENTANLIITLTVLDVALMMDLLKTARLAHNPRHIDSWLDKAGYAACGGSLLID